MKLALSQSIIILVVGLLCAVSGAKQSLIRQCSCDEYSSCKQMVNKVLPKCANRCQHHLVSSGANFEALKMCAKKQESRLKATFDCLEKSYPNACAKGVPKKLPQRYKFGIELALVKELQNTMKEANIKADVNPLVEIAKKFGRCARNCIAKKTDYCMESKKCVYDLPSDTELVKQSKQCLIQSKFLVPEVVQELCFCVADAGLQKLRPTCKAIPLKRVFGQ
uniref:Uncharacterized protein n=1 Tax=Syphacia muris TaxID=451379 RepID=A0A0N5AK65_9BILA